MSTLENRWHLIAGQIIARDSRHIAMAINAQWARAIVTMLNAVSESVLQDAGGVAVETKNAERLNDLRQEFERQIRALERRAERAEQALQFAEIPDGAS